MCLNMCVFYKLGCNKYIKILTMLIYVVRVDFYFVFTFSFFLRFSLVNIYYI